MEQRFKKSPKCLKFCYAYETLPANRPTLWFQTVKKLNTKTTANSFAGALKKDTFEILTKPENVAQRFKNSSIYCRFAYTCESFPAFKEKLWFQAVRKLNKETTADP